MQFTLKCSSIAYDSNDTEKKNHFLSKKNAKKAHKFSQKDILHCNNSFIGGFKKIFTTAENKIKIGF